jgi:hypothetical protein
MSMQPVKHPRAVYRELSDRRLRAERNLTVELEKGVVSITIGVNKLAERFNKLERERTEYADPDDPPRAVVTDPSLFALEIVHQLLLSNEDGRTQIDEVLDAACEGAADRGAAGIEVPVGNRADVTDLG